MRTLQNIRGASVAVEEVHSKIGTKRQNTINLVVLGFFVHKNRQWPLTSFDRNTPLCMQAMYEGNGTQGCDIR
jgi:hypothetical protein